jgi:hypothetical protein
MPLVWFRLIRLLPMNFYLHSLDTWSCAKLKSRSKRFGFQVWLRSVLLDRIPHFGKICYRCRTQKIFHVSLWGLPTHMHRTMANLTALSQPKQTVLCQSEPFKECENIVKTDLFRILCEREAAAASPCRSYHSMSI